MSSTKKGYGVKNPPPKKGAWSKKLRMELKRVSKKPNIKRGR